MRTLYNGSASIIIDGDTFPIVGAELSDQLHARIIEERQHIYDYLPSIVARIRVSYSNPDIDPDNFLENGIDVRELRISRSGSQIVFAAAGLVKASSQEEFDPGQDVEATILAQSKLSISTLTHIANYYISHRSDDQALISDLKTAGSLDGIIKSQAQTVTFHNDLSFAVMNCLKDQPVNSSDIRALRFITTALLLHVMPARIYQSQSFISTYVQSCFPKIDVLPRVTGTGQASNHTP